MPQTERRAPSEDRRWRIVEATMRRHGYASHAVIEALHTAQESFGYLDRPALEFVADSLRVPRSRVYGVASFYHHFTLKPAGDHTCVVCTGTACYIQGSPGILAALEADMQLTPGQTTSDGRCSLLTARCLGSCSLAPTAVFDGDIAGKVSPASVLERVRAWRSAEVLDDAR